MENWEDKIAEKLKTEPYKIHSLRLPGFYEGLESQINLLAQYLPDMQSIPSGFDDLAFNKMYMATGNTAFRLSLDSSHETLRNLAADKEFLFFNDPDVELYRSSPEEIVEIMREISEVSSIHELDLIEDCEIDIKLGDELYNIIVSRKSPHLRFGYENSSNPKLNYKFISQNFFGYPSDSGIQSEAEKFMQKLLGDIPGKNSQSPNVNKVGFSEIHKRQENFFLSIVNKLKEGDYKFSKGMMTDVLPGNYRKSERSNFKVPEIDYKSIAQIISNPKAEIKYTAFAKYMSMDHLIADDRVDLDRDKVILFSDLDQIPEKDEVFAAAFFYETGVPNLYLTMGLDTFKEGNLMRIMEKFYKH